MNHTLIYDVHETYQKLSLQFYRNAIRHYNRVLIDKIHTMVMSKSLVIKKPGKYEKKIKK